MIVHRIHIKFHMGWTLVLKLQKDKGQKYLIAASLFTEMHLGILLLTGFTGSEITYSLSDHLLWFLLFSS